VLQLVGEGGVQLLGPPVEVGIVGQALDVHVVLLAHVVQRQVVRRHGAERAQDVALLGALARADGAQHLDAHGVLVVHGSDASVAVAVVAVVLHALLLVAHPRARHSHRHHELAVAAHEEDARGLAVEGAVGWDRLLQLRARAQRAKHLRPLYRLVHLGLVVGEHVLVLAGLVRCLLHPGLHRERRHRAAVGREAVVAGEVDGHARGGPPLLRLLQLAAGSAGGGASPQLTCHVKSGGGGTALLLRLCDGRVARGSVLGQHVREEVVPALAALPREALADEPSNRLADADGADVGARLVLEEEHGAQVGPAVDEVGGRVATQHGAEETVQRVGAALLPDEVPGLEGVVHRSRRAELRHVLHDLVEDLAVEVEERRAGHVEEQVGSELSYLLRRELEELLLHLLARAVGEDAG